MSTLQQLLLCIFFSFVISARAQYIPDAISYQAVARNVGGNEIVNQNLTVRIGIAEGNADGVLAYEEIHDVVTNSFGLFTLEIGRGLVTGNGTSTSLEEVLWGGQPHFMRVEIDTPESGSFEFLGSTELISVPYAYHASTADSAPEMDGDPQNELITSLSLNGNEIILSEGSQTHTLDLSAITGTADGDGNSQNELISGVSVSETDIIIQEGGMPTVIDASGIAYRTWQQNGTDIYHDASPVGVGTSQPKSTLHVQGSYSAAITTFVAVNDGNTDNYSLDDTHQVLICNVTDGDINILLPSAVSGPGRMYHFRKFFNGTSSSYSVTLTGNFSQTIDGLPQMVFNDPMAEYMTIISDGANWYIIAHSRETP